jgi:hypothetical protein
MRFSSSERETRTSRLASFLNRSIWFGSSPRPPALASDFLGGCGDMSGQLLVGYPLALNGAKHLAKPAAINVLTLIEAKGLLYTYRRSNEPVLR